MRRLKKRKIIPLLGQRLRLTNRQKSQEQSL